MKKLKVAMVYTAVPHYRRDFYRRLNERDDIELTLFCQNHLPGFNLKLIHRELNCEVVEIPFWGEEKKIVWQNLPVIRLWKDFDVIVFYGLPRIVSNVLWATLFRVFGKPIVIYGQAFSFRAAHRTEWLRLMWWRRCFANFLVYTDREAELLQKQYQFNRKRIIGINNGLDQSLIEIEKRKWNAHKLHEWQIEQHIENKPVILSIARLVEKNNFSELLNALPKLIVTMPDLVWCVIGDGEARHSLEQQASSLGVTEHIRWLGAIYDEEQLAPHFMSADVMVHPAAIGLSLNHAFGYGVPVITHGNIKLHGPEIAALVDGENGLLYEQGDVDALTTAIVCIFSNDPLRTQMGVSALSVATTQYNTAVMAERFAQIVHESYEDKNAKR